jgi:type IV secretory pathway VirB10-like protein
MLTIMGRSKRLEPEYAEHLATVLRPIVAEQFDNNQTRASEAMGIAQSHLSQILMSQGAGIAVLIRIRAFLGNMTIDDMLGLPKLRRPSVQAPPAEPASGSPDASRVLELLRAATAAMEQRSSSSPPPPPVTKETHDAPRRPRRR